MKITRITAAAVVASLCILVALILLGMHCINAALYADSPEAITIDHLRAGRWGWLSDGCPTPPYPEKYLGTGSWFTGYVSTVSVTLKDPDLEARSRGLITEIKYHGLFAMKESSKTNTYVITTTGAILVFNGTGKVRLLEKAQGW